VTATFSHAMRGPVGGLIGIIDTTLILMSHGESQVQVVNFLLPYKKGRIIILLKYLSCGQELFLWSVLCNITRAGAERNVTTYIIPE